MFENKETLFLDDFELGLQILEEDLSYSMLVSIENFPEEQELFWNSIYVEPVIKYNFIVVRMNFAENRDQITNFSEKHPIDSIPCLFYFAPNSNNTVTKEWNQYPQPKTFKSFFTMQSNTKNAIDAAKPGNAPVSNISEAISVIKENQNTFVRIAIQYKDQTIKEQFNKTAKLQELFNLVNAKFGPNHQITIFPNNSLVPNVPSMTFEEAGLYPSAKLIIKDDGDQIYPSSYDLPQYSIPEADDHTELLAADVQEENQETQPQAGNRCSISNFLMSIFSFFDPWTNYEEKEDFFEVKAHNN